MTLAITRSIPWPSETPPRSEEHTSELQSQSNLVCRLLLEKKKECLILKADSVDGLDLSRRGSLAARLPVLARRVEGFLHSHVGRWTSSVSLGADATAIALP